jgi:hypothetical protein
VSGQFHKLHAALSTGEKVPLPIRWEGVGSRDGLDVVEKIRPRVVVGNVTSVI